MRVCILVDNPRFSAAQEGQILFGYDRVFVADKCARVGLLPSEYVIESIRPGLGKPDQSDFNRCLTRLNDMRPDVIVPLDGTALNFVTGKSSILKWHLSPLDTLPSFTTRKAVPTFHVDQVKKQWHLNLYFEMALRRAAAASDALTPWERKPERYQIFPHYDEAIATLEAIRTEPWHSIDIETGRCQINTFGVAWSGSDALAIKVLPDDMSAAIHHKVWGLIRDICESDSKKVMQNGIFEQTVLSRYGIRINNFVHDTMVAQKFLWPELEKGLDNVGRIYTMEPYWKDAGREATSEGGQKDWDNVRDWNQHGLYNCRDTSNTFIAMEGQRRDLTSRNLAPLYDSYLRRLFDECVPEMCGNGLPLNIEKQKSLIEQYEAKVSELSAQFSAPLDHRSSQAKIKFFRNKGYKIEQKRRASGESTDSMDELAIKKLRMSHPDDRDIQTLLNITKLESALSKYLRVRSHDDNRIRYMIGAHNTETGRFSCTKDPWDRGFNAQTMTDYAKQMIEWGPDEGRTFIEVDLRQAETRFVAMDAGEEILMKMLERDEDIHSYVAAEICNCSMAEVIAEAKSGAMPKNLTKRQLGKKSGHGANYGIGVVAFADSCLKELDLVLDRKMATRSLESYHRLFPGIRRWHHTIADTVRRERRLTNPLGRERYFYGRTDDSTFREAYAYRPQSTVPDVINHLMLRLCDARTEGRFDFALHLQCHDSLLMSARHDAVPAIAKFCLNTGLWHPKIVLSAGQLVIPTEVKYGTCLGALTEFKG